MKQSISYWAKCWFKKLSFKFLIFWVGWFIIDCDVLGYSRICIRDVWFLEIKNYFNVQKHNSVLYMYVLLVVLSLMYESGWKEPLKFVLRWVSCATSGLWVVNPTRGAAFTQSADELQHPHPLTLLGLFYDKLLVLTKYQVGRYRCLK